MHLQCKQFCERVKTRFPLYFVSGNTILDVGSLDVNGNNRYLFDNTEYTTYTGVDVAAGPNVDIISPIHELWQEMAVPHDVIISTEMLEHDPHYVASLQNMVRLLEPSGLLILTCATTGRLEHGTARTSPGDSPLTQDKWPDYYKNLTISDILAVPGFIDSFEDYHFEIEPGHKDLYFWGIKRWHYRINLEKRLKRA